MRSRSHGSQRVFFYACSSYYRRGKSVCPNKREVPLDATEVAVLDALEHELLTPAFVETVVRKVLTRRVPTGAAADELRATITARLKDVRQELDHLVEGLARTEVSPSVAVAIKRREGQQADLERELGDLQHQTQFSTTDIGRLEHLARERVLGWRKLLRKHVPQARQVLQKMPRGRLTFKPEQRGKRLGYRFTGQGSLMPLLTGMIPEFAEHSQAVASPKGMALMYSLAPQFEIEDLARAA